MKGWDNRITFSQHLPWFAEEQGHQIINHNSCSNWLVIYVRSCPIFLIISFVYKASSSHFSSDLIVFALHSDRQWFIVTVNNYCNEAFSYSEPRNSYQLSLHSLTTDSPMPPSSAPTPCTGSTTGSVRSSVYNSTRPHTLRGPEDIPNLEEVTDSVPTSVSMDYDEPIDRTTVWSESVAL